MNRDTLYRECARAGDEMNADDTAEVKRIRGGAWVHCWVLVHNFEVAELLAQERRERANVERIGDEMLEVWEKSGGQIYADDR